MARLDFYDSPEWAALRERVRDRDGRRCTVGWLLGGACDETREPDVHHILSVRDHPELRLEEDNCLTACMTHHPRLEALVRALRERRVEAPRRCPHQHPTRAGREACERARTAA